MSNHHSPPEYLSMIRRNRRKVSTLLGILFTRIYLLISPDLTCTYEMKPFRNNKRIIVVNRMEENVCFLILILLEMRCLSFLFYDCRFYYNNWHFYFYRH